MSDPRDTAWWQKRVEDARADERAKVVAWLRAFDVVAHGGDCPYECKDCDRVSSSTFFADAIERGEHDKPLQAKDES